MKKMKKGKLFYFATSLFLLFLLVPLMVGAQGPVRGYWSKERIVNIIQKLADWLYYIALALAIIFIIIGGIQYMTAAGNDEKVAAAKKRIMYGIIGAVIVLAAGIILDTVVHFLELPPVP